MNHTPEEIEAALTFNKVGYDDRVTQRVEEIKAEIDRKSKFLLKLFDAIDSDYRTHSQTESPFSSPVVQKTDSGITYFEFDTKLSGEEHLFQIEICERGYFVNGPCEATFLPDDIVLPGRTTRKEQTKTLFPSEHSIISQILRGYAFCTGDGPMIDIENRIFKELGIEEKFLGIQNNQKPETVIEHIENANKHWKTFASVFRKAPHLAFFVK